METENEMGMEELENIEEPEQTDTPAEEPTEAELAEEALELTEEEPAVDPKDAVIGGMRRQLREAERRADRAEAQLEMHNKPPEREKSPIEIAAEEQGVSVKEVVIDGELYRAQRAWDKKQAEGVDQQTRIDNFKKAATEATETMTDEVCGKGLGLKSLQALGGHLLDDLDQQRIFRAGENCGKEAMKILRRRIIEAGGKGAKVLKARIEAHKTQAKPKTEKGKSEQPEEEKVNTSDRDTYLETIFEGL